MSQATSESNRSVRLATPGDFPEVFALLRQLWPTITLDWKGLALAFNTAGRAPNQFQFCRQVDGRIVGFATLAVRHSLWQQAGIAYVGELVVNQADRGQGHGKALLEYLCEYAASRGCSRLELDSGFSRTGSHAMYEHCGMTRRGFVFSRAVAPATTP